MKSTTQENAWLGQLHPTARVFISLFYSEDADEQLSDKKVFEKFQNELGNAYLAKNHAESIDPTKALFEKSFNQWVFTLHQHAKLTPSQVEGAYCALHYDSVNISTYRTDELAKLHAVLLEQYPKHYLTLLENYNQILSNAMDGPFPITLDQERSVMQHQTESNIAKLSIFMICKLLNLPGVPSPLLTHSIIFKNNSCVLNISDAFKFYEEEIISAEELAQLIEFAKNTKDYSYIEKMEIFCASLIESIDVTDAFKYSLGTFTCDTKKYQLLLTILLCLPSDSIKRIEFNLSNSDLSDILLPGDESIANQDKDLGHTREFVQYIGNNKLHWMLISLILCKSRPVNSNRHDMSPLLEILNPLLKVVSNFDTEFKRSQKSRFFTSEVFIVKTFELLNSMCHETEISEELFRDYCVIGKNHTLALNPIAAMTEECAQMVKDYQCLREKISAEQRAILDFDKIKNQAQAGNATIDLGIHTNQSQRLLFSSSPFERFDTQSDLCPLNQLSSRSLFALSSSSSSISSSSPTYYSLEDLEISQSELKYLKKKLESFFSIPFDAECPDQHLDFYNIFKGAYDKIKKSSLHSLEFFQPPANADTTSLQKELVIFSKLPNYIQSNILSSLHKIRIYQNDIVQCQKEHKALLEKIMRLLTAFIKQCTTDTDIDSTIQGASMPFLKAKTQTIPLPKLERKALKRALFLLEITEPHFPSMDSYMDVDTQNMNAHEKVQADYLQASVMIHIKNLGQSAAILLRHLYQRFPRQMQSLRDLTQKQCNELISEKTTQPLEQRNKKTKQSAKTELNLENIALCGQDFAVELYSYLSKTDVLNLATAIKSFSQSPLSKRDIRKIMISRSRSHCFSPDKNNKRFSNTENPISPDIMSLIKSGAPNLTIRYGSPDKRVSTLFLPSSPPSPEIRDITPSIYLYMLFISQRAYSVFLSESLVYKTLKELGYSNSLNVTGEYYFTEIRVHPNTPLIIKRLNTDHFEIDIYQSGKIIIRATPGHKKAGDKKSHLQAPTDNRSMLKSLHIKKTKDFYKLLQENFEKSLVPLEIIEANLSEDHLEVLCLNAYTLRFEIYHEFYERSLRGIQIVAVSFPYPYGEVTKVNSKWPRRTPYRYIPIHMTSEIIRRYGLQNSPLTSWTFSNLTHTNRPSSDPERPEIFQSPDIKIARKLNIFCRFNVHQLPKDEDFFSRLAPLKFLQNLTFTHESMGHYKDKPSYIFASEALKALNKLPELPALKSVSLTSGKGTVNIRQYKDKVTFLSKSLKKSEASIGCSKAQIKDAKARLRKINGELRQTQDSAKSSLLNEELSALKIQLETDSFNMREQEKMCKSLRSEINILAQRIEFIERKTKECRAYATEKLHEKLHESSSAASSEFCQNYSLIDNCPKLEKITLDGGLVLENKGLR